MQTECCVPNCSFKLDGGKCKLYSLPNPVENKALIEKWVHNIGGALDDFKHVFARENLFVCEQHYQPMYRVYSSKTLPVMAPKKRHNEFKTTDTKRVKLCDVQKCGVEKLKVKCPSSNPLYMLQKNNLDGKEKPAVLVVESINRRCESNDNNGQATIDIEELIDCSQLVKVNRIENADNNEGNAITAKKIQHNFVPKALSHKVINTEDLAKTQDTDAKEANLKFNSKDLYKSLINPTSKIIQLSPETLKTIIPKHDIKLAATGKPLQSISTNSVKAKPTILKIDNQSTPIKAQKEMKVQTQKVTFVTKNFSKLLRSSSVGERIRVDTETVKKGKVNLVIKLESVKSTDMVKNPQVKEIEKQLTHKIVVDTDKICVMDKTNLLSDVNKKVSKVAGDVIEIEDSDTEDSEINIGEVEHPELNVAEVTKTAISRPTLLNIDKFSAPIKLQKDSIVNSLIKLKSVKSAVMVKTPQVKEKKKLSAAKIQVGSCIVKDTGKIVAYLNKREKVDVTEINDSEFNIAEFEHPELNVAEVTNTVVSGPPYLKIDKPCTPIKLQKENKLQPQTVQLSNNTKHVRSLLKSSNAGKRIDVDTKTAKKRKVNFVIKLESVKPVQKSKRTPQVKENEKAKKSADTTGVDSDIEMNRTNLADVNEGLFGAEVDFTEISDSEVDITEDNVAEVEHPERDIAEVEQSQLHIAEVGHSERNTAEVRHSERNIAEVEHGVVNALEVEHPAVNVAENESPESNIVKVKRPEVNAVNVKDLADSVAEPEHVESNSVIVEHSEINAAVADHPKINVNEVEHPELEHPESNSSKVAHTEVNAADVEHPEINVSEVEHPKINVVKVIHPEIKDADVEDPANSVAELKLLESNNAEIEDPESNISEAENPEVNAAEVPESNNPESNNAKHLASNIVKVKHCEVKAPEVEHPKVNIVDIEVNATAFNDRVGVKNVMEKFSHQLTKEAHANSNEQVSTDPATSEQTQECQEPSKEKKRAIMCPEKTEPPPTFISELSAPLLFTRLTDKSHIATDDRKSFEVFRNKQEEQNYIIEMIDAAKSHKLPYAQAERVKCLIKSVYENYHALRIAIIDQDKWYEDTIKSLKMPIPKEETIKKPTTKKVRIPKRQAFEILTEGMTEDAIMIIRMLFVNQNRKQKPFGRRFNLREKLFSLALYKLSRQAYRYMSTILPLPGITTLRRLFTDLYTKLLFKDCSTDIISHEVKDGPIIAQQEENGSTTNINSQQNDETVTAVAAITGESGSQNANRCTENNKSNNDQIEYVANQITYPNVEAYTDEGYTQGHTTNNNEYINEIVFTQYVDQTNDQTPKILQIPSNYGTISIGYSEYTQKLHHQPSLDDLSNSQEKKENLLKLNKINAVTSATLKKPKRYISGMTKDKIQKIDFILSKLMTPDQLKNVYPKPTKKKSKKTGVDIQKQIKKHNVQRNGVTKRALGIKNDTGNIMKRKRNFKTITPALSNEVQMNLYDVPEGVSDLDPDIINTDKTRVQRKNSKDKKNMQLNRQNYVQHGRIDIGGKDHTTERFSRPVQVIANEYIDNSNAVDTNDTVAKLRRNLEKYSPKAAKISTKLIDELSMVHRPTETVKILSNVDYKKVQSAGKRKKTCHLEKEPVEVKRTTKLVIDESKFPEHTSRKCFSPELFVLGTRDVRPSNETLSRNVNTPQYENNPSYETEEPVSGKRKGKGFDMPDLNEDFKSSVDKKNRKKIGLKRIPTNPYLNFSQ